MNMEFVGCMAGANTELNEFSFIVTALESQLSPVTLYF